MFDLKNAMDHLKNHQTYPAAKADLVKTCNELKDFSAEDKKWFEESLPDRTYSSAQDVINALGLQKQAKDMEQMPSMTM